MLKQDFTEKTHFICVYFQSNFVCGFPSTPLRVFLAWGIRSQAEGQAWVSVECLTYYPSRKHCESDIQHPLWAIKGVIRRRSRECCTKVGGINPRTKLPDPTGEFTRSPNPELPRPRIFVRLSRSAMSCPQPQLLVYTWPLPRSNPGCVPATDCRRTFRQNVSTHLVRCRDSQ